MEINDFVKATVISIVFTLAAIGLLYGMVLGILVK